MPALAQQVADAAANVAFDPENPDYGIRAMELIIVTADKPAVANAPVTSSLEAIQPQSIITRQAIDQFVPATADYTQIINLSPSVSGTAFNGPGLSEAKSTLRGFKDGEYNVTYDNIPWGDANGPTHHSTSFFPSSTIGAVVVDRGPGSAGTLGQATFGGSVNLYSPEVSHELGGSQQVTYGSWNTIEAVTKLNTGDIGALNGARLLLNFQELKTDGYLSYSSAKAFNQLLRGVLPISDKWSLTLLGTWNYTKVYTNDNSGATLDQVALYGKNYALNNDPTTPNYYKYNVVTKHTWFNYGRLNGEIGDGTRVENTAYSYYYKNDTESTTDVTLTPADIAAKKGLSVVPVAGGPTINNGHIPGYTKLNMYKIYGDTLRVDQELAEIALLKAGVWWEQADTGPRGRTDYDASANRAADYRQKAVLGGNQNVEYWQFSGWNQWQPFADLEIKPVENLTLTPGFKFVNFRFWVNADINQKSRQPYHASKTFNKPLYFLTANYKVTPDLAVYAQYATGFLVPDISQTQVTNPNLDGLKPQQSRNYQVGAVYHSGRFTLDGDLYYINFTNKLQSQVNPTTNETEQFNLGGAIYKGIEGQGTFALFDGLYAIAGGSLNSAKTKDTPSLGVVGGKQIAGAPKSTASAGLLYRDGGWSVSFYDKYTGVQWGAEGEPAAYRLPGYHQADLTIAYSFDRFRLQAAVYNVFDSQKATLVKPGKTVPYDQYYFQPERSFQVSAKVSF